MWGNFGIGSQLKVLMDTYLTSKLCEIRHDQAKGESRRLYSPFPSTGLDLGSRRHVCCPDAFNAHEHRLILALKGES